MPGIAGSANSKDVAVRVKGRGAPAGFGIPKISLAVVPYSPTLPCMMPPSMKTVVEVI
jgi:hypothetical protein